MVSSIYFAGGEDLDFQTVGGYTLAQTNGTIGIDTNPAHFRPGYARYGLSCNCASAGFLPSFNIPLGVFSSLTSLWLSFQIFGTQTAGAGNLSARIMTFADNSGIVRLYIYEPSSGGLQFFKVTAAGAATQLGSNFTSGFPGGSLVKVDIQINYGTSGLINVYFSGTLVFTFSGDTTTDGNSTLGSLISFSNWAYSGATAGSFTYSEIIVSQNTTQNMSLVTRVAMGVGNTQQWTDTPITTLLDYANDTGTNYSGSASVIFFERLLCTVSGQVTSLTSHLATALVGNASMAIYSDNSGAPQTLLGSSGTTTNPGTGRLNYNVSSGPILISGTYYWIAFLSTASYSAVENASTLANQGYTLSGSSFPATVSGGGTLTTNLPWMGINLTTPGVSGLLSSDAAPDTSSTAAQIQEYTMSPAVPTGALSVVSVVQHGRVTVGSSGPQHFEFLVRTGSTDYASSSLAPTNAYGLLQYNWDVNPNTSAAWQISDLNAVGFNAGYQSVT